MSDGLLVAIVREGIGIVFLVAAGGKFVMGRERLLALVRSYRVVPRVVLVPLSASLPWIELAAGAALLVGVFPRAAAGCAALLFVAFAVAMSVNLARGRRDLACGCFGVATDAPISWTLVARNLGLAALLLPVADRGTQMLAGFDPLAFLGVLVVLQGGMVLVAVRSAAVTLPFIKQLDAGANAHGVRRSQ